MDVIKPSKYIDDIKNLDNEIPAENLSDKPKTNSSTSSKNNFQNNVLSNNTNLAEEIEENRTFKPSENIKKEQHNNKNTRNETHDENSKNNNGKLEENRKQTLELPFINYSKKRKNSLNYIRVRKFEVQPRNDIYEASDEDLDFISDFNRKNEMNLLNIELFEQLIVLWEGNSEKDYPIGLPQAKSLTVEKLEKMLYNKIEEVFNVFFFFKSMTEKF